MVRCARGADSDRGGLGRGGSCPHHPALETRRLTIGSKTGARLLHPRWHRERLRPRARSAGGSRAGKQHSLQKDAPVEDAVAGCLLGLLRSALAFPAHIASAPLAFSSLSFHATTVRHDGSVEI